MADARAAVRSGTRRVLVIFHSGYGHTRRQAEAVAHGASEVPNAAVTLVDVDEPIDWADLERADAVVLGCPTYMGGPSAQFKAFMDATSNRLFWRGAWADKLAAGFTCSASQSGDKLATLTQLALFAAQHRMIWVSLGLIPANNSSQGSPEDLNRLGFYLGAGAQANADEGPQTAPPASDLRTAAFLGRRIAELALRLAPVGARMTDGPAARPTRG